MKLPFRHLLFLVMTFMSIIPITAISFWSANSALENEYKMVHDKHLLLANNITTALNRYAVDALAIFTAVTNTSTNKAELDNDMQLLLNSIDVASIAMYQPNGQRKRVLLGSEQAQPEDLTSELNPFELTGLAQARFTPVHNQGVDVPTLYMIRQTADGNIWLATLKATYIEQVQNAVIFGEKGHAAIVDQLGNVLAHPNKQWQSEAKNISKISIVQQMMAGESGVSQFYSPAVKADMIAGFDVVPATGWGVMIPQPLTELDQRAFDVIKVTLLIAFVSLLVCCAISWWIVGLITRPIDILTAKTRLITEEASDTVSRRYRGFHTAEFAKLFDSFRQMSLEIRNGREELEIRVARRTADLAQAQAKALHLANHDTVTGLANRVAIREQIASLLHESKHFSLLFIDLDGFKAVNDQYGHKVGDILLKTLADKVNKHLFIDDVLARYGGDEFIVLMPNMDSIVAAECAAEKLLQLFSEPLIIEDKVIAISACIGLALSIGKDKDTDSLIHRADTAMYRAKHQGKNQVAVAS
ncbi:sensor domain-containing diguanylate cyclase [Shewanella japonica]|uniref:Diguanylate cyclase n=1 Tax=Shewanella japonica TaxID=93973 RepID=A0ABN4YIP2_9GAMM|nr:sensor domain-containing diguanylate cyclase [Shewanella japonica]ARD20607.1 Diguanylate cyclase [Shewanella japonica]